MQQQPLGEPKANAWAAAGTQDNDDEEEESDDSEKLLTKVE
jgi:hypothetical protein